MKAYELLSQPNVHAQGRCPRKGEHCVITALHAVQNPRDSGVLYPHIKPFQSIVEWNDTVPHEEVIATLRKLDL
jgi:hypothetical protein